VINSIVPAIWPSHSLSNIFSPTVTAVLVGIASVIFIAFLGSITRTRLLSNVLAGIALVAAAVVGVAMVCRLPLPWVPRPPATAEQLFNQRIAQAQARSLTVAEAAVTGWSPASAGDIDFTSVTATLAAEPSVRRVTATDYYDSGTTFSQTLLRVDITGLSNQSTKSVRFSFGASPVSASRPDARFQAGLRCAPPYPLLFTQSVNGMAMRSAESGPYNEWSAMWDEGSGLGLSFLYDDDGSPVTDADGRHVPLSWGDLALAAPTLTQNSDDLQYVSSIESTVGAGSVDNQVYSLVFVLPNPPAYDAVGYDDTDWTPLSQSLYPFIFGGLFIVSDDWTTAAVIDLDSLKG